METEYDEKIVYKVLYDPEINMVARDGNFYFRKTSLGTGFSACNCLFDSRNCLLASLILGAYYKLNWPKRASAVYWLLGTLLYPCWFGLTFRRRA